MKKKSILITGGTGKLGRCFATHFAKNGWNVVITSTSEERASKFIKSFSCDQNITFFISDLSEPNAANSLIQKINAEGIEINHLINNARSLDSLQVKENGFSEREHLLKEFTMHVAVPYELSVSLFQSQKDSLKTIVNIGSQYGSVAVNPSLYNGDLTQAPIQYGIAKSALHHLTKELSVRFIKHGIRVNCVAFGGVEGRSDESFKGRYSKLVPSGRMLNEHEVIGPIEFLLSDSSSSITGEIIAADGGWTSW
jgi:NAD(P)-dependent dehydrogenase (short-subunit alcohol dehydrogenase family)|tara:strand:- start:2208 stop:2966 length:759 start_codon:yes stop_codon:yes gene_type:complete